MKKMCSALLKERITLQTRHITSTEEGDLNEEWHATDTVWAYITPVIKGAQEEEWDQEKLNKKYKVTIRYRDKRFKGFLWNHKAFVLISPCYEDKEKKWLTCWAIEKEFPHD